MKIAVAWIFVVIWFFHLAVGAGAAYAAYRLWSERSNGFVRKTMIHLHAAMIDAIGAIVALFVARDVHFTWKFSCVVFAAMLARDCVRLPLILYVIRGPEPE